MKKVFGIFLLFACMLLSGSLAEELAIASPGESGYDVERILAMAKSMGYIKNMEAGEENYREKYIDGIKAMEAAFSLEADGVIRLSEMQFLEKLIYPGCKGSAAAGMLEKLYDLGFIAEKLPSNHDTYSKSYASAVKKAEKQYGLREDGVLTADEQLAIKLKTVAKPDTPANVKISASGTTLTVTWSKAKGALSYDVYINGTKEANVTGTSYTYKNAVKGEGYGAQIVARKYTVTSPMSTDDAWLALYATPTVSELVNDPEFWAWKYVKISNTKMERKVYEGNDIYILVKKTENGKTHHIYLKIADYKSWTEDDTGKPTNWNNIKGTIRGEGYFLPDTHYSTTYRNLPVIELTHLNWEY